MNAENWSWTSTLKVCGYDIDNEIRSPICAISRYANRINFETQQIRAINLAQALLGKGIISSESHVAIIGGGIAGVTISAFLLRNNCKVTLFEKEEEYFSKQKKSYLRFVHPSINFWPQEKLRYTTNLPVLNWHADSCDRVISQINSEWEEIAEGYRKAGKFKDVFSHEFEKIIDDKGSEIKHSPFYIRTIEVKEKEPCNHLSEEFHFLVDCTGFSPEGTIHGINSPSYWESSHLPSQDIVICGSGDGGLIDAILHSLDIRMEEIVEIAYAIEKKLNFDRKKGKLFEQSLEAFAQQNGAAILDDLIAAPKLKKKTTLVTKEAKIISQNTAPIHRILALYSKHRQRLLIYEGSEIQKRKGRKKQFDITIGKKKKNIQDSEKIIVRIGQDHANRNSALPKQFEQDLENNKDWVNYARNFQWEKTEKIRPDHDSIFLKAIDSIYRWLEHRRRLNKPRSLEIQDCGTYFEIYSDPIVEDAPDELFGVPIKITNQVKNVSIPYAL